MAHDVVTMSVALMCLWGIASPRIPTGTIGTAGLGTIAVAALWSLDASVNSGSAIDVVFGGMGLVCFHVLLRVFLRPRPFTPMRRTTDWGGIEEPADTDQVEPNR